MGLTALLLAGLAPARTGARTDRQHYRPSDRHQRRRAAGRHGLDRQSEPDRRRAHRGDRRTGRLSLHAAARRHLHRDVQPHGLHQPQHRGRQAERRRHRDDQRQAGRGLAPGEHHRHQPVADHRPRIVEGRGQLGPAEARRAALQPQPHRPGLADPRPVCHVARRRRLELRHRLRPRGAHVRPRRRRRRQLRRHDLGPDLRRLRHLRRSADHDRRQGRRRR